jgi:outer membrane lipoprotein-sorting protein
MNKPSFHFLPIFAAALILISGCIRPHPLRDPALDKKAGITARNIMQANQDITASKGLGWIRVTTGSDTYKYKIAWAAVYPDKIRISFLMSGHPVETIAADGEGVTFISHTGGHQPHTTFSKDPDMYRFINVPVKLSDLISVLLGRLPVKPHDFAFFSPGDPDLRTLVLKRKNRSLEQILVLNPDDMPQELKTADEKNRLLYRIAVTSYAPFNNRTIPASVRLSDAQQRNIDLTITSFQANPAIKQSVFRLTAN